MVKCNMERVRPATDQEWLGAELLRVLSAEAKACPERKGQRGYVDATNESGLEELLGSSSEQPGAEDSTDNRDRVDQEVRSGQMPPIPGDRQADPLPRERPLDRVEQSTHDSGSSSESSSSSSSSSLSQEATPKIQTSLVDNDPKRPELAGSSSVWSLDREFASATASESGQPASVRLLDIWRPRATLRTLVTWRDEYRTHALARHSSHIRDQHVQTADIKEPTDATQQRMEGQVFS